MKELLYGKTRTYIIGNGDNSLLIDTDWAGTLPHFFRKIKEADIVLDNIQYLIIIHYHPDHMGIAAELMELGIRLVIFDVQLPFVHFSDSVFCREKNKDFKSIDESNAIIMACIESRNFLAQMGIKGEVIHTPGHSEDSISLILDDGTAIVGDLPPYSALSAVDDEPVKNSYDKILSHGVTRIYYGHMMSEKV